jgi:tRNA nucleotidyltransferase/poly(A) polymerase
VQKISCFLAAEIQALFGLKEADQKLYFVGGIVRDYFVERLNKDIDIVCNFDTTLIARKFATLANGAFYVLDSERNSSRVIVQSTQGKKIFDFTRLKGNDILFDLSERDFTINAMAVDLDHPDEIIDPLFGKNDLKNGILRECSERSFSSDPVRVIRAVRYSLAYALKMEEGTFVHLKGNVAKLGSISGERKRDEFFKILDTPEPLAGIKLLVELGILSQMDFPYNYFDEKVYSRIEVLSDLFDPIFSKKVKEQTGVLRGIEMMRFSPATNSRLVEFLLTKNTSDRNARQRILLAGFLRGMEGEQIKKIVGRLLLSREESEKLLLISSGEQMNGLLNANSFPDDREVFRYFKSAGEAGLGLALVSIAEFLSIHSQSTNLDRCNFAIQLSKKLISSWFEHPEVIKPQLFLNGNDLMVYFDLTPGSLIGELLESLCEEQAAGAIKDRDQAMLWVENQLNKINRWEN